MRIYAWKKPKLEIELLDGGDYTPNTKYYITSYFHSRRGAMSAISGVYYGGHSPLGELYEVTTTDTQRGFRIHIYTDGNIQSFSNYDGKTLVTSINHRLGYNLIENRNNIITISGTTHYDGVYEINWIDYDSFYIDAPFVVDETGYWRCDEVSNSANSWKLFISDYNPVNKEDTDLWNYNYKVPLSHSQYATGYTISTVDIYDVIPVAQTTPNCVPKMKGWGREYIPLFEMGMIAIEAEESYFYPSDLGNEFEKAHISHINIGGDKELIFFGFLEMLNNVRTWANYTIICRYGIINAPNLTMQNSVISFTNTIVRNFAVYKVRNSITTSTSNIQFDGWNTDADEGTMNINSIYIAPKLDRESYSNLKIYGSGLLQAVYPNSQNGYTLTDSDLRDTYIYLVYSRTYQPDDNYRVFKNISFSNNSRHSQDFRIYTYGTIDFNPYFENIDTDLEDNLKRVSRNTTNSVLDVYFWRKTKINVGIENVKCTIHQETLGDYVFYSDENGDIEIDIIEQISKPRGSVQENNVYYDYIMTLEKDGYQTYTDTFHIAKDFEDIQINLLPNIPPKYITRNIESNIKMNNLNSEIEEKILYSDIKPTQLTGDIQ